MKINQNCLRNVMEELDTGLRNKQIRILQHLARSNKAITILVQNNLPLFNEKNFAIK